MTWALGANSTSSMAASYECDGVSSGMTNIERLARAREVSRHAVHEVRLEAVKIVQVLFHGLHRHVVPARSVARGPRHRGRSHTWRPVFYLRAQPAGRARRLRRAREPVQ